MLFGGLSLLALPLIAGCTTDAFYEGGSRAAMEFYQSHIRLLRAQYHDPDGAMSTRQYEMLSDYWVTDAEFHETVSLFEQCMSQFMPDLKIEITIGSRTIMTPPHVVEALGGSDAAWDMEEYALSHCDPVHYWPVMEVWGLLNSNPQGLTLREQVARCWDRQAVDAPQFATEEDFEDFLWEIDEVLDVQLLPCIDRPWDPESWVPLQTAVITDEEASEHGDSSTPAEIDHDG